MVNFGKVSQNLYGLTSGTAKLMNTFVPKGAIATSQYGQFFKNANTLNRTNSILMTLQLNSIVYSYFRDQKIKKILLNTEQSYKATLSMRNFILDQLFEAYKKDNNISRGEIGTILSKYPIFSPYSSGFLENFILQDHFHLIIMNSTYTEERFGIANQSKLNGFQRVVLALDALSSISAYEDDDYARRLNEMIDAFPDDNWLAGVQNAVAGAFSGDDAYKIFNTEDFKRKTIPSYIAKDSKTVTTRSYYQMMYYNTFVGDIGYNMMAELSEIGRIVKSVKDRDTKQQEEQTITPTLLLTLPNGATIENNQIKANQGDTISFYPDITAGTLRECIADAGESATYILGYSETNNQANKKSLSLNFDSSTHTFSFTMPSSEIALLDLYYRSGDTTQSCGVLSISENTNDIDNTQSTLSDVEWIQQIKAKDYGGYGHRDIGRAVVTDSLGNVFVSGNTLGGLDGNDTQNGNEFIFLGKFTPNGEKLWINQYGRVGEHFEVHSMVIDNDDNLYISGWIGFGGMDARPLLYKFNKNGILLWKNELPINYEFDESQNEIQLIENGIILVSDRSGRQSGDKNHIVVRKFSFNGNLLWTKNIEEDKIIYFKSTTTDNKNLYILGNKLLDSTPGNIIYEPIIYKVDSNGNQLNETVLDINQSISVNSVKFYKNNFYIRTNEYLDNNEYKHHLFKIDINGNNIWRNEFNKEQNSNDNSKSLEIYNDIIYLIGSTNANKEVWLSKHALNGTLLGKKSYLPLDDVMSGVGGEALTVGLDDEIYIVGNGQEKSSYQNYSSLLFKVSNDTRSSEIGQNINLIGETPLDNTIVVDLFTKEWKFSQDISNLTVSVLGNSYQNSVTENNFIKDGQTLKVNLTPNQSRFQNKLILQFTDTNGNLVKVSGSETFWSLTKTNHAPRLADGQITQLVSDNGQPARLDIATYDSDGDSVTLSVEDRAGGTVSINGNTLSASFSDGEVAHTIKIGLSDGKEKVVKEFTVLEFNQNSIESFYSDVDKNSDYFYAIAFGTLKGVIGGEIDPNDSTQRIFRPTDNASLAEALKMIINAEVKAGLIELLSSDYYMEAYPTWAMKYYTFAREKGALDRETFNLAEIYPTREVIAKLIVKTLDLEKNFNSINLLDVNFSDGDAFSDADMRHYGEIAHKAGLFMKGSSAKPQEKTTRAELATVIAKIFMIPHASLSLTPQSVEQGEANVTAVLNDLKAQAINSNHELYDSQNEVTMQLMANEINLANPMDSDSLNIGENSVYALLDNRGVKNIINAQVTVTYADSDGDGIQDSNDKWNDDTRYAYDDNGNGIPDILDLIYNLDAYDSNDTVTIDGKEVYVGDMVRDGGVTFEDNGNLVKTLTLKSGWNLVGINSDMNLSLLLDKVGMDNLLVIQGQVKTYQKSYADDNLNFLNDFTFLEVGQGYWIKVNNNVNVSYDEVIYTDTEEITLTSGWNLINPPKDLTLEDIIAQLGSDNLLVIQGAVKTYQKRYVDEDLNGLNDFEGFTEPEGYWIKVAHNASLVF